MYLADSDLAGVSVAPVGRRLFITVPWKTVENLRSYLRRHGIGSTAHLEPANRVARLEPWDGVDPHRLQYLLAEWEAGRRPAAR